MAHPEKLGKYRVTGVLGEGAMGIVYKGFDPDIRREVAIKTMRVAADADAGQGVSYADRFRNEAQAAGRVLTPDQGGNVETLVAYDQPNPADL